MVPARAPLAVLLTSSRCSRLLRSEVEAARLDGRHLTHLLRAGGVAELPQEGIERGLRRRKGGEVPLAACGGDTGCGRVGWVGRVGTS